MTERPGGALLDLSYLFVDIRGSTRLAEDMPPDAFARFMNDFYRIATDVLVKSDAFIDKFVGDEVMAVYLPVFCGPNHAAAAIRGAQELLRASSRGTVPSLPLGVGVNTGVAYFGTVKGADGAFADFTALGDAVNVAARLASAAAAGEGLIGEVTALSSQVDLSQCEMRELSLKGKSEPISVRVLRV